MGEDTVEEFLHQATLLLSIIWKVMNQRNISFTEELLYKYNVEEYIYTFFFFAKVDFKRKCNYRIK